MAKPICGDQGGATDDAGKKILLLWSLVGTTGSLVGLITNAAAVSTLPILGISGAGIGVIGLSAAAASLAVLFTVFSFYWDRCLDPPEGLQACAAGVVNAVVESFNTGEENLFPFIAMHDYIKVVVKSEYWPLVQTGALYIDCTETADGEIDANGSPILQCVYETREVCYAGVGAVIGAAVAGLVGIVLGIIIGAAIGCAATGPFYPICLIFAAIIAAIVAAVITAIGAFVGGQIGKAAAGEQSPPGVGNPLQPGDYVTVEGNMVTSGDFEKARVFWFVEKTTLHGRSTGSPQFSYEDPDANLTDDACPDTGDDDVPH
jgi:hypothetical protein